MVFSRCSNIARTLGHTSLPRTARMMRKMTSAGMNSAGLGIKISAPLPDSSA